MDNWLVKFASKQTTSETQFRQQVDSLSFDELRELVGPSPTGNIDSFQEKAASAVQQGRQLAHEAGYRLLEKSAQAAQIDQSLVDAVSNLSDEAAIKLAEMLENGTDVEKIAGIMGMAGGALKSLGGMAVKHPHAAAGIGGAAVGAMAGGSGNRMSGAIGGASLGLGMSALPGAANKIQKGGFAAGLKGQQMMGKMAGEVEALYKTAFAEKCTSSPSGEGGWLTQFEGSPLLEQAVGLAEAELQLEIQDIQKRQERAAAFKDDDFWTQRDIMHARKKILELQLVAQRNGIGAQQEQPPAPEATPPPQAPPQGQQPPQGGQQAQKPEGVGGPGGVQMPMGQQKQASVKRAFAGLDDIVGLAVGLNKGKAQHDRGEQHTFGGTQVGSLFLPGGVGYQIGRGLAHHQASTANPQANQQQQKQASGPIGAMLRGGAVLGGTIGGVKGALRDTKPGESRLGAIGKGTLKGGLTGGAIGGGLGLAAVGGAAAGAHDPGMIRSMMAKHYPGAMDGMAQVAGHAKVASLPFVVRR